MNLKEVMKLYKQAIGEEQKIFPEHKKEEREDKTKK